MAERFQNDDAYEKMILSFRQGDQASLGQLYDKYAPALLGVITRILESPDLSCDCLQHCFNEFWNKKSSYDNKKERIFTWMIKIARNSALDILKNGHGSFSTVARQEDSMGVKNNPALENSNAESPVSSIDAEQREVLDLVYIKGFSFAETATQLNTSLETVKSRFILAVKNLKVTAAV